MRNWSEEESQQYVERFRGYRGNTRCRECGWFGHRAHHCRRVEIEAEREQRGGLYENRWKPLRCRVMACEEERLAAHSERREVGHRLWTCPTKAACPPKGEAQQERKVVCKACKREDHVARNCNSYWRRKE